MAKTKRTRKKVETINTPLGEMTTNAPETMEKLFNKDLEEIDQEETTDQEGQQAWQKGKGVKCGKNEAQE